MIPSVSGSFVARFGMMVSGWLYIKSFKLNRSKLSFFRDFVAHRRGFLNHGAEPI